MANWVIPFMSMTGTDYEVRIGGAAARTVLTGASSPITTGESNDDVSAPVVTQTGYVTMVDVTDSVWRDLLPTSAVSRPVTLVKIENNVESVMWIGYLSAETYGGDFLIIPQAREFPLICPLAVLESYDIDPDDADIVNFGWILDYCFSKITDFSWQNVYFQGIDILEWLQKKVMWSNFCDIADGEVTGRYTCLDILREVCKFWGLSCRLNGLDIYFCSPDDSTLAGEGFTMMDFSGLALIGGGATPTTTTVSGGSVSQTADTFASADNTEEYVRGIRKAEVVANINKQDYFLELDFGVIEKLYRSRGVTQWTLATDFYRFVKYYNVSESKEYDMGDFVVETNVYVDPDYFATFAIQEYFAGDISLKHNYDMDTALLMNGLHYSSKQEYDAFPVRVRSKSSYNFDHGMFVISAETYQALVDTNTKQYKTFVGNGTLYVRLQIGDLYWTGSAWAMFPPDWERVPPFGIPIGQEGSSGDPSGTGKIITNRVLTDNVDAYEGYGIPLTDAIGNRIAGKITLELESVSFPQVIPDAPNQVWIKSLKMSFARNTNYEEASDSDSNKYTAESNTIFTDTREETVIFATDQNNKLGYGIIMNPDNTYCTNVHYSDSQGTTEARPEQRLADRLAAFGNKVRFKISSKLRYEKTGDITPGHTVTEYYGDPTYPLSISHEWRDDRIDVDLIEIQ